MKVYLIIVGFCFLPILSFSQKKESYVWYFGNYYELDFNTIPPTALSYSGISKWNYGGSSSIADTNGKLLFYTDGNYVNNKRHEIMENGNGLYYTESSASLIVRLPLSYRYYFIFSKINIVGSDCSYSGQGTGYSIVDMHEDSGRGKVILKNQLLVPLSAGKIAAVLHANKKDVWIAIKQNFSDTLFLFLLTEKGISPNVIKQNIFKNSNCVIEHIKFSPDGKYLAFSNSGDNERASYLYRFNNSTGLLTFKSKLIHNSNFGFEFSPNSKILYWLGFKSINNKSERRLYQAKLSDFNKPIVSDSGFFYIRNPFITNLQLAPNNKIYSISYDSFLSVIHEPNMLDSNCKFEFNGQKIKPYQFYQCCSPYDLPSFVASYFKPEVFTFYISCINQPTKFVLFDSLDNDSVKWDFGDSASKLQNSSTQIKNIFHTYTSYGSYVVKFIKFYDNESDTTTAIVKFTNNQPNFEASDVCENDSVNFKNTSELGNETNYKWNFGDNKTSILQNPKHKYQITTTTTYNVKLIATNNLSTCTDSITKQVTVNANPSSTFNYTQIGNDIELQAQAGYSSYKWKLNTTDSFTTNISNYTYNLKNNKPIKICLTVTNLAGCNSQTCTTATLSTKSVTQSNNFKIYPNPNNGWFTIYLENENEATAIKVYDALGKSIEIVKKEDMAYYINAEAGIYFVKLKRGENIYYQRLFINALKN